MSKVFDVAAYQFELENGIEKDQAIYLIGQLPAGQIIPFFTSANNTSAAGFIAHNVFEKFGIEDIDELIIKFIESIINDQETETVDGLYDFNGVSISLQYKPIIVEVEPIEDITVGVGDFSVAYQTKRKCYAEFVCSIANRLQVDVCDTEIWQLAVATFEFTTDEFFNEGTGGDFEWYVPTEAELKIIKTCF